MKNCLRALAFTLVASPVFAIYYGNPSYPKMPEEGIFLSKESWLIVKTFYQGDWVMNRRMGSSASEFSFLRNSWGLTFLFNDRTEFYGSLGSMKAEISDFLQPQLRAQYETDSHLLWGAGARMIIGHWGDTEMNLNANYLQSFPTIETMELNGVSVTPTSSQLQYKEVQGGLGFSHRIDPFIPYLALKYSAAFAKLEGQFNVRNRTKVGFVVGCGFTPYKTFAMNLEVRMVDEEAFALTGNLRF